jgi:thiol-disulfide isomerase/thioredoxin
LNFRIFSSSLIFSGLVLLIEPDISLCQNTYEVNIEAADTGQLKQLISDRKGKPLLIIVWATWCVPCREEFPDLVSLAEKYNSKIDFIGFSVDFKKEKEAKVIPFLKEYKVNFPNFIVDVKDPEEFINLLNEDWSGAVPATFLYDSEGEQVDYIIGKSDFKGFEKMLSKVE